MSVDAFIMMILVLGLIWGGFGYSLALAMKREKEKADL